MTKGTESHPSRPGNQPGFRRDRAGTEEGSITSMEQGVRFGGYRFDIDTGRLWFGAGEIRLTPKAAAVLNVLVTHAGEPVSKERLFAAVWSGVAVSDDALTSCVQELRKALDDDPRQPRFIETRHRRGYRFVASLATVAAPTAPETHPATADVTAIGVLPFADMSPDRDQDYLCEGLAEELISALTHIDGLRVASRTASFQFRGGADVRAVGQQLGVGTLLEGSVRKADDRLRVTVQLVEVVTGYHRWSQRFDRRLDDVFAIQDEIAESVATSLRGNLLSRREKQALVRPPTRADAYEYYLRGRQHLPRMTKAELQKSGEMFARAIELDAAYAPAYAGLAMVHATLYEWFGAQAEDLVAAERASERALELAPGMAEAHVARGCALALSSRYADAERAFEQSIRINPNLFDAYYYSGRTNFARGDITGSAARFRKAEELRRDDFQSPLLLSQSLRMLGSLEEAAQANREGIRRAEHVLALNPADSRALSLGASALFHDGQTTRALEWSRRSLELYPDDMSTLVNAACLHSKLRQKEEALDLLERVFAHGLGKRDWVEHDPDYDILRADPRFLKLLARLK
jgi:TolB-like protein/Flp pilus assembly protein TadD